MSQHGGMSRRQMLEKVVTLGGMALAGRVQAAFALRARQTATPIIVSQAPTPPPPPGYAEAAEAALAEPFKGITTNGTVIPGLFSIQQTGLSTTPIQHAAEALLISLSPQQRENILFPMDSDEWRRWSNIHRYPRQGVALADMTQDQREKALALLEAGLSQQGFTNARDIMRLNETVAELTGKRAEYGEGLYWFTIMGRPSAEQPWGWQLDGHHLVINYMVLGDQIVMTPTFMGSEPTRADGGKYAGTRVFQAEEEQGLRLMQSLTSAQREQAIVAPALPREVFTAAFRDNIELPYAGLRYDALASAQQALLLDLMGTYIGNIRPGHAGVKMEEVKRHLPMTHFAWMGGVDEETVFYYRVQSPVVLIEFDHQRGIALGNDQPSRNHIHTVVRTPNGNDYGKDLLRQNHAQFDHSHGSHERSHTR